MSDLFLTPDQLHDLTGYVQAAAQIRWLRKNGIAHYVRADGRPMVTVAATTDAKRRSEEERERLAFEEHMEKGRKKLEEKARERSVARDSTVRIIPARRISALIRESWAELRARPSRVLKDSAAYARERKQAIRRATPAWANLKAIKSIYQEARRISRAIGIPHHVDHDYPIKGVNICGLHVESNLRIISAIDNVRRARIWRP